MPGYGFPEEEGPPDCDSTEASSPTLVAERPVSLAVAMGLEAEEACAVTSSTADDEDDVVPDSKANVVRSGEGSSAATDSGGSRTSSLMQPLKVETAEQRPEEAAGSPQPGPSGLQRQHAAGSGAGGGGSSALDAPDLQLDWLSSDTEDSSPEDDVTVVRIARKKKSSVKDQQPMRRSQQVI